MGSGICAGTTREWRYQLDGRLIKEVFSDGSYWETTYNDVERTRIRTLKAFVRGRARVFKLRIFLLEIDINIIHPGAIVYKGKIKNGCVLQINSECIISEVFGDVSCDCKWQLDETFRMISQTNAGMIIYSSHHEGRSSGLFSRP